MKFTILTIAALVCVVAHAEEERDITKICEYAQANDRGSLRAAIDDSGIDLRRAYSGIKCDKSGHNLLRISAISGSVEAAKLIASRLGKGNLSAPGADGVSDLDWLQKNASDAKVKAVLDAIAK